MFDLKKYMKISFYSFLGVVGIFVILNVLGDLLFNKLFPITSPESAQVMLSFTYVLLILGAILILTTVVLSVMQIVTTNDRTFAIIALSITVLIVLAVISLIIYTITKLVY